MIAKFVGGPSHGQTRVLKDADVPPASLRVASLKDETILMVNYLRASEKTGNHWTYHFVPQEVE